MNKIPLRSIAYRLFQLYGFGPGGCLACDCQDACCQHGCEVDKASYELAYQHREALERELGVNLDSCYTHQWSGEQEFLGNDCTRTTIRDGRCALHRPAGKGCVLYGLVEAEQVARRLIPSICRLYPLSWEGDVLCCSDDLYSVCDCQHGSVAGRQMMVVTHLQEIEDIFDRKV